VSNRKRTLPQPGTFVRVISNHPRKGAIVEVTKLLQGELLGWALVKFSDGMVSCLKASHMRRVVESPLVILASQGV
jgi:hypothetical protein